MAIIQDRFIKILEQLGISYSHEENSFMFGLDRDGLGINYVFEIREEDKMIIAKSACLRKINENNVKVTEFCNTWHQSWSKLKLFWYNGKLFCDWCWDLPDEVSDKYLTATIILSFIELSTDCYRKAEESGVFA